MSVKYLIEHSPSPEANSCSDGQQMQRLLGNPCLHYNIKKPGTGKYPELDKSRTHTHTRVICKIRFNLTVPSMLHLTIGLSSPMPPISPSFIVIIVSDVENKIHISPLYSFLHPTDTSAHQVPFSSWSVLTAPLIQTTCATSQNTVILLLVCVLSKTWQTKCHTHTKNR